MTAPAVPFGFDPSDETVRRDPFPLYARARRECPVYRHPGLGVVSVFRHRDIADVLADTRHFSSDFTRLDPIQQDALARPADPRRPVQRFLVNTDGDEHDRLLAVVKQGFTPQLVADLEPAIRAAAVALLDQAAARDEVDFVDEVAIPLTVEVITNLVGVPLADREKFREWSEWFTDRTGAAFFGPPPADIARRRIMAIRAIHRYLRPLIEQRRAEPVDDLVSALAAVEVDGNLLEVTEVAQTLTGLLVAGHETTTSLMGNMVVAMVRHPAEFRLVRADRSLLPSAVDEVLRCESPAQAIPRRVAVPTRLGPEAVETDEVVLLWLGSANRDDEVFDHPDRFDVTRSPNRHLSFGRGLHHCLGAPLSRLQARVMLDLLLELSAIELVDEHPPMVNQPVARGFAPLRVHLTPGEAATAGRAPGTNGATSAARPA